MVISFDDIRFKLGEEGGRTVSSKEKKKKRAKTATLITSTLIQGLKIHRVW